MDDGAVGRAIRTVRIRRGWRQADLADAAGVSRQVVGRIERGELGSLPMATLARVATALGIRLTLQARWRGGELDRLLGARHSALHEALAGMFAELPEWVASPEVTFAVYGERGAIDVLAWHARTRTLLVIEIKTEITDVQEMVGTLDRKQRLAPAIAKDRGWVPARVATWLVVAGSATNRRRVAAHRAMLRSVLPADGRSMSAWLRNPRGSIAALSFWSDDGERRLAPVQRVRRRGPNGSQDARTPAP